MRETPDALFLIACSYSLWRLLGVYLRLSDLAVTERPALAVVYTLTRPYVYAYIHGIGVGIGYGSVPRQALSL